MVGWVIVVLIAAFLGKNAARNNFGSLRAPNEMGAPHFPANSWVKRDHGNISLSSPLAFGLGPDISSELPADVSKALEHYELLDTGEVSSSFRATISRVHYKPSVQVSLDGAMNGSITQATAALGDVEPNYTSLPIKIDGLQARRATYRNKIAGRIVHIDAVSIQHEQKIWQVTVFYSGDAATTDAKRLLDSIHIFPSK